MVEEEKGIAELKSYYGAKKLRAPTQLANSFEHCSCNSCLSGKDNWLQIFERSKKNSLNWSVKKCLCAKVERTVLKVDEDTDAPWLYNWDCTNHCCKECGVESALPWSCPVFNKLEDKTEVWVWEKVEKRGNMQQEAIKKTLPVREIITNLNPQMNDMITHRGHLDWLNRMMRIDVLTCPPEQLLIFIDFASQMDLEPTKKSIRM